MYTIREVSEMTGLSAHTLRFYEKEGLLPGVERSPSGIRRYSELDLGLLGGICSLKNTGMPLREIARFMQLARQGDSTLRERYALLETHRNEVLARMEEMQAHLDKVTRKLDFYGEKLRAYESREEGRSESERKSSSKEKMNVDF